MPEPRTITRRAAVGALRATALGARDQAGKRNLRRASGLRVLISDPDPRGRVPLTLATSHDGHVSTHPAIIDDAPGGPRMPGHDKGSGSTYPHAIERDGCVSVIDSRHRADLVLRRFSIAGLERLAA